MLLKSAFAQTRFLLKQKAAVFAFYILLVIMLVNFIGNVLAFQGYDAIGMYHPMKMLLLSYNKTSYNGTWFLFLVQFYPLLVICPAGFSLAREQQTGQDILLASRLGNFSYRFSKLIAVILTTAIVFSVPFLIEILLNCISFPLTAQGDMSNLRFYDPEYIESVKNYFFQGLYLASPYLYAIVGTLWFGLLSGLVAGFSVALFSAFKPKFLVFLFLPSFVLLNASIYLAPAFSGGFAAQWNHYFFLFDDVPKRPLYFCIIALILLICAVFGIVWGGKRDCIK